MTTLSIIVPCYKQRQYIDQCITSILNCNPLPNEIIASANHCPDGGHETLLKYKDRLRLVQPPAHLPTIEHFNYLASLSTSSFTSLVCADDYVDSTYVQVLRGLALHHPEASVVRAAFSTVNGLNRVLRRGTLLSSCIQHGGLIPFSFSNYKSYPFSFLEACGGSILPMISWAFNTDIFRKCGFFNNRVDISDWEAFLTLSTKGPFISSRNAISYYRTDYRSVKDVHKRRARKQLSDALLLGREWVIPGASNLLPRYKRVAFNRFRYKLLQVASQYTNYLSSSSDIPDLSLLEDYDYFLNEELANA